MISSYRDSRLLSILFVVENNNGEAVEEVRVYKNVMFKTLCQEMALFLLVLPVQRVDVNYIIGG